MRSEDSVRAEIQKYITLRATLEQKRAIKNISPTQFEMEWTILDEKIRLLSWVLGSDE